MSDHLVRVENLKSIQRSHGWDDSTLARQCGKLPQQVHAWFSNKRNIGEKLARQIEERLGLGRYALDDRTSALKAHEPLRAYATAPLTPTAISSDRELPVLAWTDIHKMLDVENATLKQKATHLQTFAVSSGRAKFLQMPDDSMAPDITAGDHLLLDPAEAPRAGDVVLIRLPSGEHFVRVFRPRTAHVFEGHAANPAYQPLSSQSDEAVVVAVMVEHRRYRRHMP